MICPYSHKWHWLKFRYSPRKVLRYNDQTNGEKKVKNDRQYNDQTNGKKGQKDY